MKLVPLLLSGLLLMQLSVAASASSKKTTVDINSITEVGVGEKIGTVVIEEKQKGLSIEVDLTGILPGEHGFHLHEKGDCGASIKDGMLRAGLAAGGHYDPDKTKSHKGPMGNGHKGDLPFLTATDKGVNAVVTAPKLTLDDVRGRALVIHAGGDNYTDHPENGGGMGRVACGVVPKE
jgi:Cu-Zn family superoxide dismutase